MDPVAFLRSTARASEVPAGTSLYVFGSASRGHATPNDIDVLVVYPPDHVQSAHALAELVRNALTPYVFDVLVLSADEERELAFIRSAGALEVWSRDAILGDGTA